MSSIVCEGAVPDEVKDVVSFPEHLIEDRAAGDVTCEEPELDSVFQHTGGFLATFGISLSSTA